MPGICLFVCLLATFRKNYWTDLEENFTTDVSVDKEELVNMGPLGSHMGPQGSHMGPLGSHMDH